MSNNDEKLDDLKDNLHEIDKKVELIGQRLLTHLEQDEKNLERISVGLDHINERLSEYNSELSIHIQGVKEAMENNRLLREQISLNKQEIEQRLSKLEDIPKWVKNTLWLLTALGTAAAGIMGIQKLF